MDRVVIYGRVSTTEQTTDNQTVTLSEITSYCHLDDVRIRELSELILTHINDYGRSGWGGQKFFKHTGRFLFGRFWETKT